MNTDEHSAVQPQPKPISPRRRWSVKKIVAPASRRQVSLDNSLCVNSLCRLEAGPTFFSRDRRERAGRPWERTHPACSAFLTARTQDACASRKTHKNPLHAGKNFSADRKLFVILRVLRVFVVDWVRSLPRRCEDAKNRQVFGCGSAALCSSVVSFCGFYAPTHCKGAGIFTRGMGKREVSPCSCKMNLMD